MKFEFVDTKTNVYEVMFVEFASENEWHIVGTFTTDRETAEAIHGLNDGGNIVIEIRPIYADVEEVE